MSKKKLLIREVFDKIKRESPKDTKSGWADDLSDELEKKLNFIISAKTLSRYYDSFVAETKKETGIETLILDKLSQYVGYKSFNDFNLTVEKKTEGGSSTSVRFLLDGEEVSVPEKIFNIIIKISNNPNFNVPDFMKKNGLGVLEFLFVSLLVTGGIFFSSSNPEKATNKVGFYVSSKPNMEKNYMYWNGEEYIATDSSYISPHLKMFAMNKKELVHFKKITRKDTMTLDNSLGRVWCSKFNNEVDFFTMDGVNPDNGKELKLATDRMILKYSGKQSDSAQGDK